jgi:hypothetical protein
VAAVGADSPGTSGGPGTSVIGGGEPEQSCEAGEYLITLTFVEAEGEEVDYELDEADIQVKGHGADGSETEVELRGDLNDARSLIATLVAEGNCVHLEAVTSAGAPDSESGEPAAPDLP